MSDRADLFAALAHRQPAGRVPLWELEFHAWDAWSGGTVVLGEECARLTAAEQERALYRNAELLLGVCAELGFAALTTPNGYWHQAPGQLAYYVLPGEARWRQMQILRALAPPELVLVGIAGGVMGADYSEDFCARLYDEPETVDAQAEATLQGGLANARRMRDLGLDVVVTASDIADNSGPFFKRDQMARWILPYLARWATAVRAMGLGSILHSDGQLTPYLEDLAATGLDGLQAVDPVAGMDLHAAQPRVAGRLCLCGNVDCGRLLLGTPEELYASTRALLLQCKAGGNWVLGSSNAVQREVPQANYRAMVQAWRDHGRYGTG